MTYPNGSDDNLHLRINHFTTYVTSFSRVLSTSVLTVLPDRWVSITSNISNFVVPQKMASCTSHNIILAPNIVVLELFTSENNRCCASKYLDVPYK